MPTLIYCTAFAEDQESWSRRYRPWFETVRRQFGESAQILIVDDGSPNLPAWPDLHITTGDHLGDAYTAPPRQPALLFHFRTRLGRRAVLDFPGWHRSFCFGALFGAAHGFDRIIHIESDAAIISERARITLTHTDDGWCAPWCGEFDMPESAIQVAAGTGIRAFAEFARQPYHRLISHTHERLLPFTGIFRELSGSRVGEWITQIPADADFAAQIPHGREQAFGWFRIPGLAPSSGQTLRRWSLLQGGDGVALRLEGWSAPEPAHCWMEGAESTLRLPPLNGDGHAVLRLRVTPHVWRDRLVRQRLAVEINGQRLDEWVVRLEALLGCDVPAGLLGRAGGDVLRLVHPDAASPADISPETPDGRRLALSVEWFEWGRP